MGGAGLWGKLATLMVSTSIRSCKFSRALTVWDFHTGYFRRWRWASRILCHHTDDVVIFIQLHLCSVLRIEDLRKGLGLLIGWARYIIGKYLSISFTNGQRLRQTEEQILSLELAKGYKAWARSSGLKWAKFPIKSENRLCSYQECETQILKSTEAIFLRHEKVKKDPHLLHTENPQKCKH